MSIPIHITSDDYFRFGGEYTEKILKELNITNIEKSRINGGTIIEINIDDNLTLKLLYTFFDYEKIYNLGEHLAINKKIITDNYFIIITDFTPASWRIDNWKNYKKIIRKLKIKNIEKC